MPRRVPVFPSQGKRYERIKDLQIQFPEQAQTPPLPEASAPAMAEQGTMEDAAPYPNLRFRLRDMGLPFQVDYRPAEVAIILRKSDRTIRAWIRKELVAFHTWPSGERYFTPQDLEEILAGSARNGKEVC